MRVDLTQQGRAKVMWSHNRAISMPGSRNMQTAAGPHHLRLETEILQHCVCAKEKLRSLWHIVRLDSLTSVEKIIHVLGCQQVALGARGWWT